LALAGARSVGGTIGTGLGIGVASGAIGAFLAYEIWEHLSDQMKVEAMVTAEQVADGFVNVFIKKINERLDNSNFLSFLGVGAPQFEYLSPNSVDPNDFGPPIGKGAHVGGLGKGGGNRSNAAKRKAYESLWGQPPPPGPPPWPPPKRFQHRPQ